VSSPETVTGNPTVEVVPSGAVIENWIDPVGLSPPDTVAVSDVVSVPTTPSPVTDACVETAGEALIEVIDSLSPLSTAPLFSESPEYEALQV
jgi:hypothetical protein